jgi:hypothetical protein
MPLVQGGPCHAATAHGALHTQLSDFDRTRAIASTILAILICDSIAISPG